MPPLPKRKYPKTRQRKRRQHLGIKMPHVVTCQECRSPKLAHRVCPICGVYRGRTAIDLPDPEIRS
ncbi:MAG: 50S ribosomal protein L32 [Tepidiformaceae bacterium]